MQQSKPSVLILSSVSVKIGPAKIAGDMYTALSNNGFEVDLLLPYREMDHPEYLFIRNKKSFFDKLRLRLFYMSKPLDADDYYFFYHSEKWPIIPAKDVVKAIRKQYDLVYVIFWQEAFSFRTMQAIYDKLKCLMVFANVDYSTMSGGCHFSGTCTKYQTGCGQCPVYNGSLLDSTHQNVLYRENFRNIVKPVLCLNRYMYDNFYSKSYLWKDYDRILVPDSGPIINTDVFKPIDSLKCRSKYGISESKSFVILIGCNKLTDPRKGLSFFLEALEILYERLSREERVKFLVMALGQDFDKLSPKIRFDNMGLGYRNMQELPEIFSAASCFVCPSVNDAGPMMVNQSLCCGTPVVGFDMGAVKSVVKNRGTGYCAELRNSADLAGKIEQMFRLSSDDYELMKQRCREVALATSSFKSRAEGIIRIYEKYGHER